MTVVAIWLVLPIAMPAPTRRGTDRRPSAYQALRRAPAAWRAIAVMAAVNLGISLVELALLPIALDSWSSDAAGFGLASGVLGFAAFGAPLLRRLGATPVVTMRRSLLLVALGVLLVAPAPTIGWALVPLAIAGAAAVSVEASATSVLQEEVSDDVRASVFGLNDSIIVAAALIGTLLAPVSVKVVGGGPALAATAVGMALAAWWARPSTPATGGLPSGISGQETDEHVTTPANPDAPHVPAQRTGADWLLDVEPLPALEHRQ